MEWKNEKVQRMVKEAEMKEIKLKKGNREWNGRKEGWTE